MNGRDRENPPGGSTPQRHASDEQFEELLARALRIDVPEAMPATAPRRSPPIFRWAALAAGLLMEPVRAFRAVLEDSQVQAQALKVLEGAATEDDLLAAARSRVSAVDRVHVLDADRLESVASDVKEPTAESDESEDDEEA